MRWTHTLALAVTGCALLLPTPAAAQTCQSGYWSGMPPTEGSRIRVMALSPDDTHYDSAGDVIGIIGTAADMWRGAAAAAPQGEDCWFSGQLETSQGTYSFTSAAIRMLDNANPCPTGALSGSPPATGDRLRVQGLWPGDGYYDERSSVLGIRGTAKGGWSRAGKCWYGGQFEADDGSSYYFYAAAFMAVDAPADPETSCPAGAYTGPPLPAGERVRVLAVSPDDAYYPGRDTILGISGEVQDVLQSNDGCWMGGGMVSDAGEQLYFYEAAVQRVVGGEATAACDPGAFRGDSIPKASQLRIVGVGPDDAYGDTAASFAGLSGQAMEPLRKQGACYYAGEVRADNGREFYFYQGEFNLLTVGDGGAVPELAVPSCPSNALRSAPGAGTRVRVISIAPVDPAHERRAELIGASGSMPSTTSLHSGCWFRGNFDLDGVGEQHFTRVALERVETASAGAAAAGSGAGTCPASAVTSSSIPEGTQLRLVALDSGDSHYRSRANFIGLRGEADEDLTNHGDCWFGGRVVTDGGEKYTFFMAAFTER